MKKFTFECAVCYSETFEVLAESEDAVYEGKFEVLDRWSTNGSDGTIQYDSLEIEKEEPWEEG